MSNPDPFTAYLQELRKSLATGAATEHTHRSALQTLLQALGDGVQVINEPKHIECGAPDFIITHAKTPVGYVEAKDVDTNLDKEGRSEQLDRYRSSLSNLILTDYLEFRWYVEGEHRETARLATVTQDKKVRSSRDGVQDVADLFQKFFAQEVPTIGRAKDLAQRMASLARMIRSLIEETFKREREEGMLHTQLKAFRETLIPDLRPHQFADMYAQTITYGLFAARVRVPTGQDFTREKAAWNLPPTNPFLRKLFHEIAGPDLDKRIAWLVDDLAHLLARADMSEVLEDFGKAIKQEDPVVHFYETFLAAYDPGMRQTRGVYYTPEPVVQYIVRSLDHIVKTRFDRPLGLADTNTLILDPAAGTATFLYFVIQQICETVARTMGKGVWSSYVVDKLLPRVFGFELLMAPYAMAHMKLSVLLQETGYDFAGDQRLGIYLTNSLEEAIFRTEVAPFARYITEEANAAAEVKREKPIMVVLGNPPYSVSSANKGPHIERLMGRYKKAVRDERNIQPLSDDYIKFIRFAHDRIERTGYGVVGMITNHSYLSGLIHRGMREELMKTFDEIYVLNLHGNALLGETAPDGGPDENVFDIRQGVAIALFVKKPESGGLAIVKYSDLWGLRKGKYDYLLESDITSTDWQGLEPAGPYFFFVPKEFDLLGEYEGGWSVKDIFPLNSRGIETGRDQHLIAFDASEITRVAQAIADRSVTNEELQDRYGIKDTSGWPVSRRRERALLEGFQSARVVSVIYRPFDWRHTYFSDFLRRTHSKVMRHMLRENLSLCTMRQVVGDPFRHVLVCDTLNDVNVLASHHVSQATFPLYLYDDDKKEEAVKGVGRAVTLALFESKPGYVARRPNLSPEFIAAVRDKLVLDFVPEGKGDLENTFGPEDIFHYAYAVFHSPTYRERYAEFLKIDFPRLPLTSELELFEALAEKGEELVALHLMESPKLNDLITSFPMSGSNEVEKVRYAEPREDTPGRVYVNKTQYFEGIEPDVWEFQIGGYQVLHKWLKDRKGRVLSFDDLFHYQKIVVALKETMRLMEEIDELIPAWPIE